MALPVKKFYTNKQQADSVALAEFLTDTIYNEAGLDSESKEANLTWVFRDGVQKWVEDMKDADLYTYLESVKVSTINWATVEEMLKKEFQSDWDEIQDDDDSTDDASQDEQEDDEKCYWCNATGCDSRQNGHAVHQECC